MRIVSSASGHGPNRHPTLPTNRGSSDVPSPTQGRLKLEPKSRIPCTNALLGDEDTWPQKKASDKSPARSGKSRRDVRSVDLFGD